MTTVKPRARHLTRVPRDTWMPHIAYLLAVVHDYTGRWPVCREFSRLLDKLSLAEDEKQRLMNAWHQMRYSMRQRSPSKNDAELLTKILSRWQQPHFEPQLFTLPQILQAMDGMGLRRKESTAEADEAPQEAESAIEEVTKLDTAAFKGNGKLDPTVIRWLRVIRFVEASRELADINDGNWPAVQELLEQVKQLDESLVR